MEGVGIAVARMLNIFCSLLLCTVVEGELLSMVG